MLLSLSIRLTFPVVVLAAALLSAVPLPATPGSAPGTNATPPVIPKSLLSPGLQPFPGADKTAANPGAGTNLEPGAAVAIEANPALFGAMRDFDQRFIPLLVAVAGSNAAPARAAAKPVLAAWPEFAGRCTKACPDDPRLQDSLAAAATQLHAGEAALAAEDLGKARAAFQLVRVTLMEIRARLGVDYLPDYLTRYAQPLDIALTMASKLTPTNATRDDFLRLRDYCVAVRGYWMQFVSGPRVDPAWYGFAPEQLAELQASVQAGAAALKQLETAFEGGQSTEMITTLNGMKAPYLRILAAFGGPPPETPPRPISPLRASRRRFLQLGATLVASAPGLVCWSQAADAASDPQRNARVALARCRGYGPEVRAALQTSFELLGGITSRVKGKTVTVKINLTGTNFTAFKGRPPGETYMTHYATALALAGLLFDAGAWRIRFVESTNSRASLDQTLALAGWDVNALNALGRVEFENTRNLGSSPRYQTLHVPAGGLMFSSFDLNAAYHDTDMLVSLAKLKNHRIAGVTLSLKNLFGITPNALYSSQAGGEDATAGRDVLHTSRGHNQSGLPGLKSGITSEDVGWRVPRIIVDLCGARPVDLAIVDGIMSMSQGEGPWSDFAGGVKPTAPGVLLAGFDPVATDAVGTAIMGYEDPRALRGAEPFVSGDNHLLLAEQAGLGTADLKRIEVLGLKLENARSPYGPMSR